MQITNLKLAAIAAALACAIFLTGLASPPLQQKQKPSDQKPTPTSDAILAQVKALFGITSTMVGEIIVVGNEKTPTDLILGKLDLVPGSPFDTKALRRAEEDLAATGLFVVDAPKGIRPTVNVLQREGEDGHFKDILVQVKEK
jgi:outer membrane protein assembly factor BamA